MPAGIVQPPCHRGVHPLLVEWLDTLRLGRSAFGHGGSSPSQRTTYDFSEVLLARSVCSTPGCPTLVHPAGRCAECKAKAAALRRVKGGSSKGKRGYGVAWQRTRAAYLRAHPLCMCTECDAVPVPLRQTATEVDHIDGLGPLGPRGHDWSNLRAMTKAHHSRDTARHQPGGWNDRC